MSVPRGWTVKSLDQLAETALGKMLDRGKSRGLAQVPYLRNVNVQWDSIDTSNLLTMELADNERERFGVRPGDLLVCEGGEVGRAAIWNGSEEYLAYQKALHRVRSRGGLDLKFLRYLLEHYRHDGTLARYSTGSTIAHLPQQKLQALPVPHPPLTEQKRIVEMLEDHLSRLDAALETLSAVSARLRPLVSALLQQIVPAGEVKGWRLTTIGEAGQVQLGRQRHPDWHTGPEMKPYLRVANIFEDRIDTRDVMEMDFSGVFERYRLTPGDVLLNEGQSPEFLGRPAIYRGEPPDVAFTNSLIRFKANSDVLPEWALLVFRRHMHAGRFMKESRITTNIAHLSASRLKSVEFPVPPLKEQQALADLANDHFSAIERIRVEIDRRRKQERVLRRSLLEAAFSGYLTRRSVDYRVIEELSCV
ncbi:MAG: restriction endonuclease subunit S [Pseudonocardiaceae bacterium]